MYLYSVQYIHMCIHTECRFLLRERWRCVRHNTLTSLSPGIWWRSSTKSCRRGTDGSVTMAKLVHVLLGELALAYGGYNWFMKVYDLNFTMVYGTHITI